jgi:hypothetical protein
MGKDYKKKSFLFIPYIENISFNKGLTYTQFFGDCKMNGINYDVTRKVGSVFVPYDLIEKGIMGILLIGNIFFIWLKFLDDDFPSLIRGASRTLTYIGNLLTFDFTPDSESRLNLITVEKCIDKLEKVQKSCQAAR